MGDRTQYFAVLKRAFSALSLHSDAQVRRSAVRFTNLVDLLDLKTRTGDTPTLDLVNSGLPIHTEIVRIGNDLRRGTIATPRPAAEIVDEMLDEMIIGKRMPLPQQIEDMANAVYSTRLSALSGGDSGADQVVGTSAAETFRRVSPRDIATGPMQLVYEWDFWPGTTSRPTFTAGKVDLDSEDNVDVEQWTRIEVLRAAHAHTDSVSTLLTLGNQIDKWQKARLKELRRITLVGIETPSFHSSNQKMHDRLASIDDENEAWVLRFDVERLRSKGTVRKSGGIFSGTTLREDFHINLQREETKSRQCTDFDRHAVMTPSAYKALSDDTAFLRGTSVHVVSADGLTLKENI